MTRLRPTDLVDPWGPQERVQRHIELPWCRSSVLLAVGGPAGGSLQERRRADDRCAQDLSGPHPAAHAALRAAVAGGTAGGGARAGVSPPGTRHGFRWRRMGPVCGDLQYVFVKVPQIQFTVRLFEHQLCRRDGHAVQKIVENPQEQFLERLLARPLCATTGADFPGSAENHGFAVVAFYRRGVVPRVTMPDKFHQSSVCGRCPRSVHRQSRGLRLSAKVTHMRHFRIFLNVHVWKALDGQQLLVVEGWGVAGV